jgi:hypothetical protein
MEWADWKPIYLDILEDLVSIPGRMWESAEKLSK